MAYFSNGTEQMMYEEAYCDRCVNKRPSKQDTAIDACPVMDLHFLYGTSKEKEMQASLELLIPREGAFNGECSMFLEKPFVDPNQQNLFGDDV